MNLTTHGVLAFSIGITFFHSVPIALIMTVGALIPDLDREYLFITKEKIEEYQLHRSLFHNFLWIIFLSILNPFLALGALSHSLLDSFTSATDRGVEFLFPFTRFIRGYYYQINGDIENTDHKASKKRKWWVEDPWSLLKETTDRDLQEPTQQPWRRSYGPFRNSRLVDWTLFFGSIVFLVILFFAARGYLSLSGFNNWLIGSFTGIASFYVLGEVYRRKLLKDRASALNQTTDPKERDRIIHKPVRELLTPSGIVVLAVLVAGLAVFIFSGIVGGVFVFRLPPSQVLTFSAYGLISLFVGLAIAWLWLSFKKNNDKTI